MKLMQIMGHITHCLMARFKGQNLWEKQGTLKIKYFEDFSFNTKTHTLGAVGQKPLFLDNYLTV